MRNKPEWLNKWVNFQPANEDLDVTFSETKNENATLVKVKWNHQSKKVDHVQLDMFLVEEDIECVWKPHLSPEEDMVNGDLFFYSPAMIFEKNDDMLALVPDLDFLKDNRLAPNYMDYVLPDEHIFYGIGDYQKTHHVYHKRDYKMFHVPENEILFQFYLVEWQAHTTKRDFTPVVDFIWDYFGAKQMATTFKPETSLIQQLQEMVPYVEHTYAWAFENWGSVVWQEFKLEDKVVGGCPFLVRASQKPGHGKEEIWREKKSIWNQAWFSSLRSAYGYRLWGEKWHNDDLIQKADLAKEFALAAPQKDGLFPSVYLADDNESWEHGEWAHSNRRPDNHEEFGHLLDMSWTCYWMLKWYEDIEQDQALLDYALRYATKLLTFQNETGSFPAWIHSVTEEVSPYLEASAETSMHSWFLAYLYKLTNTRDYLIASEKALDFVLQEIVPTGKWEDFEAYWSCSRTWEGKVYNEKEPRSGLYTQCNFSIYWTVEALKELYILTDKHNYIIKGEQLLGELSLYQAVWNPPFIDIPVLGGFSVMNTDDEWNDARQSLFALTYYDYYQLTSKEEYLSRAVLAMRASYYMMYCPENSEVKALYERTFDFLDEKDYGFEMENLHHGENIDRAGEFTAFDWGNGSASSSLVEFMMKAEATKK